MSAKTYALLVGIDEYPSPVPSLRGCVNDIEAITEILRGRVASAADLVVQTLTNEQASRDGVIAGFREHLRGATKGDFALFYYSGHGSQAKAPPEVWGVETDHLVETLVLHDSRQEGQWDLADKELATLIGEVAAGGAHVLVVLDCCHSGSGTRASLEDGTRERRAPIDRRTRPIGTFIADPAMRSIPADGVAGEGAAVSGADGSAGEGADVGAVGDAVLGAATRAAGDDAPYLRGGAGWERTAAPHVLLAACRSNETAKEASIDGANRGAFSAALELALREARGALTYRDVHRWASTAVRNRVQSQNPQLEVVSAAELDRPFLGGALQPSPAYYTLSHSKAEGWVIDGGAVHGVVSGSGTEVTELAVFPLSGQGSTRQPGQDTVVTLDDSVATARVTTVEPDHSRVEVDGDLDPSMAYRGLVTAIPLPPLKVALAGTQPAVDALRAQMTPARSTLVTEVASPDQADLRVDASADGYVIARPAAIRPLTARVSGAGAAERALSTLEQMARWARLSELRNTSTALAEDAVKVEIQSESGEYADGRLRIGYVRSGDTEERPGFTVTLTNTTQSTLWCALIDLTEAYGVFTDALPAGAAELAAGQKTTATLFGEVSDDLVAEGVVELTDHLKVVVSTSEFDPRSLQQEELDVTTVREVAPTRGAFPQSTLDRLMQRVGTRRLSPRPAGTERISDWRTSDVFVTTVRAPAGATLPAAGQTVTVASGLTIAGHASLRGTVRLTSAAEATRDADSPGLPPLLRDLSDAQEPFALVSSRAGSATLDTLELTDVQSASDVTSDAPLVLRVEQVLGDGERLLPVAYDGEFYLPLGFARRLESSTEIVLERLPEPLVTARSLGGSVKILFRKILGERLRLPYAYPLLRSVSVGSGGEVTYDGDGGERHTESVERLKAAVAQASSIAVYVHGIIGDTVGMVRSAHVTSLQSAPRLVGSSYDLVLAFDYENINTSIEENARGLRDRLAEVGLVAGHGKRLDVVAHSMGGLVCRHLVEFDGGREVVSRLVTLGTPNAGSPWPTVQKWATAALTLALNGLTSVAWPAAALTTVLGAIENVDVALDEMEPGSPVLTRLASAPDPKVPYVVLVGNDSLLPEVPASGSLVQRMLTRLAPRKLAGKVVDAAFFGAPNDLAVSVASARTLPDGRSPGPVLHEVASDHMSYFNTTAGLDALARALLDDR